MLCYFDHCLCARVEHVLRAKDAQRLVSSTPVLRLPILRMLKGAGQRHPRLGLASAARQAYASRDFVAAIERYSEAGLLYAS